MDRAAFQELTDGMMRLYTDGKYADALQLVEQNVDRFPGESARTTFWRMCLLSLCNRSDELMAVFKGSLDTGLWWADNQFLDSDFNNVRDLPEFKQLVDESNQKCLEARKQIKSERVVLLPEDTTKEMPLLIALHGRNGNMESRLPPWDIARQRGWLVLSPQSSQALYPGDMAGYCWDDPAQGMEDILLHINEIKSTYRIDHQRVIIGGFSQGSGMAIYSALRGDMGAQGFIGVATWWEDVDQLVCEGKGVRGYFVVGEKDHTLNQTREIQKVLRVSSIQFAEEVHPEMGHEFPSDFAPSFDKAIEFIF